jgi:GNAT superfamily N-acetyltransferase
LDPTTFWRTFASHGARLYAGAPAFITWRSGHAFANLTREPNLDLNLCGLLDGATPEDARGLVAAVDAAACPAVVTVSPGVGRAPRDVLGAADFAPLGHEQVMWRPGRLIAPAPGPFEVRRALEPEDLVIASKVIADAHGTAVDLVQRVFGLEEWRQGTIECWLAFENGEAASVGWLTFGDGIVGVWEMMTSPRFRRRGAARAVMSTALAASRARARDGAILWSSPMGAQLYEALGFETVEVVVPYVRGGTAEELALIGASPA